MNVRAGGRLNRRNATVAPATASGTALAPCDAEDDGRGGKRERRHRRQRRGKAVGVVDHIRGVDGERHRDERDERGEQLDRQWLIVGDHERRHGTHPRLDRESHAGTDLAAVVGQADAEEDGDTGGHHEGVDRRDRADDDARHEAGQDAARDAEATEHRDRPGTPAVLARSDDQAGVRRQTDRDRHEHEPREQGYDERQSVHASAGRPTPRWSTSASR